MPFVPFDFNAPVEGGRMTAGFQTVEGLRNKGQESPGRARWREPEPPVTLLSYWKMDEASGTRNDSHGSNHLSEAGVGTTGAVAAKINDGAIFSDADVSILKNDAPSVLWTYDQGITICGWLRIQFTDQTAVGTIFELARYFGATNTWRIHFRKSAGTNNIGFLAIVPNGQSGGVAVGGLMQTGFNFIRFWLSPESNRIHVRINEGSQFDMGAPFSSPPNPLQQPPEAVLFSGLYEAGTLPDVTWDEVGIWRGVMGLGNGRYLYNNGNGRSYPDVPGL